jgi:hypothetical protein
MWSSTVAALADPAGLADSDSDASAEQHLLATDLEIAARHQPGDDRASFGDVDLLAALDPCQYTGGVLVEFSDGYVTHAINRTTAAYYLPGSV